jgi:PIN domain nuclease of toxin-antitoxin system
MLNLDTHILVDIMVGHLSPKEEKLIRSHSWAISDIVLWELHKLNQLGRIDFDFSNKEIKNFLKTLEIVPIDLEVLSALNIIDFKSDPADELIAATSIARGYPLVTRDSKLLKSKKTPLLKGF